MRGIIPQLQHVQQLLRQERHGEQTPRSRGLPSHEALCRHPQTVALSGAGTPTGEGCGRRPSDRPQSAHNTQPCGSAAILGSTNTSQNTHAPVCPAPIVNTQHYLHSITRPEAHSSTRHINGITPINSLSWINPPPVPHAGRTRALAPRGTTFSPSRSSPHTEKPPRTPASTGELQRMPVPPPHGPRCRGQVTSRAEAPSASSAQLCISISSRAAAFPCAGGAGGEPWQSPQLPLLPGTTTSSQGRWQHQSCLWDAGHGCGGGH